MPTHRIRSIVTVACLLALLAGCQGFPAFPGRARASGYAGEAPEKGGFFNRLTGRKPAAAEPSEVRQASAIEPLDSSRGPAGRSTVLPPAGAGPDWEEEDPGFGFSDLYPTNVYKNLKGAAGYGPDEGVARQLYEEGEALYAEKQFGEAAEKFEAAAGRWPDSTLEEDALFMQGEGLFFSDQYPEANDAYGQLLEKYEYSRHLDRVVARLFAIGRYWEQLYTADPHWPVTPNVLDGSRPRFDTWGHAIKAYDLVRMHDPTGPLADDAVMATANAHFVSERFESAAYHYDLLRNEYPKSEHQVTAHVLGMKSKMGMYQGPEYDGTPLEDAAEIAEQALTQFHGELGEERELVLETRNRVTEEQAARDWAMAQYWEKKRCYGAAGYYYECLIRDYPRARLARLAETRLEEIKDFPSEPSNRFKWLTDMFPSETD